jgi:hypothetical protein
MMIIINNVILQSVVVVSSLPMFIVTSGRPKCVSVEIPKMTMIRIHYDAPDILLDHPTYITLLEKPIDVPTRVDNTVAERRAKLMEERKKKKTMKPTSKEIKSLVGNFVHKVYDDLNVEICVRASMAGSDNPMRFYLRVEEVDDDEEEDAEKPAGVEHHWTFLETQMDRIDHELHTIIAQADFFKERDAIYHQQTDELHKATLFWPILHVGILLVTGFTQANHIVRFFQTRRII